MQVLNAKAVTGSNDSAGIMRFVDIFQDDGKMSGALGKNLLDYLFLMISDILSQVIEKPLIKIRFNFTHECAFIASKQA
jgi:hypothetical protein